MFRAIATFFRRAAQLQAGFRVPPAYEPPPEYPVVELTPLCAAVMRYLKHRPGELTMSLAKFARFSDELPAFLRFCKPDEPRIHLFFCGCVVLPLDGAN